MATEGSSIFFKVPKVEPHDEMHFIGILKVFKSLLRTDVVKGK